MHRFHIAKSSDLVSKIENIFYSEKYPRQHIFILSNNIIFYFLSYRFLLISISFLTRYLLRPLVDLIGRLYHYARISQHVINLNAEAKIVHIKNIFL